MGQEYLQSSFLGGMVQNLSATKVAQLGDSYFLGINIRSREDVLEPVRKPLDLSNTIISGKLQGIYGAGTILLLFIDGFAYIRNVASEDTNFRRLTPVFQMDPDVDYIFAEFVPGSTLGFARVKAPILNSNNSVVKDDNVTLNRELPFNSSVQGVIYQDGINQGKLILDSGDVRETKTYDGWTTTDREYLPLMRQMLYYGGILFGISPDGKQLYHSVSGRPLDFVIPITEEGNKTGNEQEGGAPSTSTRVDFEVITAIKPTPIQDTLLITTLNKSFLTTLLLDEVNLQFDEPSFAHFPVSSIGAVNQFCFADLNGDSAFISTQGIHSFNAAAITKTESENDPVSAPINRLFQLDEDHKVQQDFPCAFEFGADYALFAVNTIYGRGVLVYDKTIRKFVSLDIYAGVSQIKQFASVVVRGQRRLFFITIDNKLYEAFAASDVEEAQLFIGEWCTNNPQVSQNPFYVHLVFSECEKQGNVSIVPLVNRKTFPTKTESIKASMSPRSLPITPPFGGDTKDTTQIVSFNLTGTLMSGWTFGCTIKWNVKAKLTHVMVTAESQPQEISPKSKAKRLEDLKNA